MVTGVAQKEHFDYTANQGQSKDKTLKDPREPVLVDSVEFVGEEEDD